MAAYLKLLDYQDYAGPVDNPQRVFIALEAACDMVREYLCQRLDVVNNDVVTLWGTGTRALLLPELPVNNVDSITLDGVAVTDYKLDPYGVLWRINPNWWSRSEEYVVTYDHGFTVVPADIRFATLRLVQGMSSVVSEGTIQSESIADYSVTYASGTTGSNDATAILSTLNHRRVKRIPVP